MVSETVRLETLRGYGILDTPAEPAFNQLVMQIAATFRVKSALISFIDDDRQWYKARVGITTDHVPRAISFCTHSIGQDAVTVVPDAREDERFCRNPYVTAPGGVRFYAAAPIKALNRARIGTVCVFDSVPRSGMTERSRLQLSSFAAQVVELLEQRRQGMRRAG